MTNLLKEYICLYDLGFSVAEIAKKLNRERAGVFRQLKKHHKGYNPKQFNIPILDRFMSKIILKASIQNQHPDIGSGIKWDMVG